MEKSPKKYIFYHIFCNENTNYVLHDQCIKIIFSGLYKKIDAIYCFLLGDPRAREAIKRKLATFGDKFIIAKENDNGRLYERFTLLNIHEYISPEDKFLYMHSKGITNFRDPTLYDWRTFLEYYVLTEADSCIEKLETHDLVGANFAFTKTGENERVPSHFSGNFWWARASYFLTLPHEIGDNYLDPEFYITLGKPSVYCPHTLRVYCCEPIPIPCYGRLFPMSNYINPHKDTSGSVKVEAENIM